jgi:hypothetical protein
MERQFLKHHLHWIFPRAPIFPAKNIFDKSVNILNQHTFVRKSFLGRSVIHKRQDRIGNYNDNTTANLAQDGLKVKKKSEMLSTKIKSHFLTVNTKN